MAPSRRGARHRCTVMLYCIGALGMKLAAALAIGFGERSA